MIIIFKKSNGLYHVFLRQIIFFNPYYFGRICTKNIVIHALIMKLTTKGRYAVMAMADIALFKDKGPISLTDISLRQNISLAYLEQIFIKLKQENLVKGTRGSKGGYVLVSHPEEIKISNIISAVDENVAKKLFDEKIISNGMIVKVENSLKALNQGVQKIHIISGEIKNALINELETEEGIGTVFQKQSLDY